METGIKLQNHQKAALHTQITTPAAPGGKLICVSVHESIYVNLVNECTSVMGF